MGLHLHKVTQHGAEGEVLDGRRQETRGTDRRNLRLWSGLEALLKRRGGDVPWKEPRLEEGELKAQHDGRRTKVFWKFLLDSSAVTWSVP